MTTLRRTSTRPLRDQLEATPRIVRELWDHWSRTQTTPKPLRDHCKTTSTPLWIRIDDHTKNTQILWLYDTMRFDIMSFIYLLSSRYAIKTNIVNNDYKMHVARRNMRVGTLTSRSLRYLSKTLRDHFETTSRPLRDHFETTSRPLSDHFETVFDTISKYSYRFPNWIATCWDRRRIVDERRSVRTTSAGCSVGSRIRPRSSSATTLISAASCRTRRGTKLGINGSAVQVYDNTSSADPVFLEGVSKPWVWGWDSPGKLRAQVLGMGVQLLYCIHGIASSFVC